MILGIGTDIVNIERIKMSVAEFGDRFIDRILLPPEREQMMEKPEEGAHSPRIARLAKYYAAKEACVKALGGTRGREVSWHCMEIRYDEAGKPLLSLHGAALTVLQQQLSKGQEAVIHLSLSDDYPMATATVIIELRARGNVTLT